MRVGSGECRIAPLVAPATLLAALLALGGCGRGGVILDHDGGADDYVAMVMVLASGQRLRGVTIAFGNSYPQAALEATERLLATYGPAVPIGVPGPSLRGKNEFPAAWRARAAEVAKLPAFAGQRAGRPADGDAVTVLARLLASSRSQKIDLLATGPLTNIAALLREQPDVASRIARLVVMGGAVRVAGNTSDGRAEYNIFVDPEAADAVFAWAERGLRIELIPLDATNHLPVTPRLVARLLASPSGPARQAGELLSLALNEIVAGTEYYLWDGGAALALLQPELFSFETLRLKVASDGKIVESPAGHGPIRVALGIRPGALPMEAVVEILRGSGK